MYPANLPVIVGVGRHIAPQHGRTKENEYETPLQLLNAATNLAFRDAGISTTTTLDSIAVVNMVADIRLAFLENEPLDSRIYKNPAACIAASNNNISDHERLQELVYTAGGGNTPQALVSRACERISRGVSNCALVVGCEALHSFEKAKKNNLSPRKDLGWGDNEVKDQKLLKKLVTHIGLTNFPEGDKATTNGELFVDRERRHGMAAPIACYPLLEQSLRASHGRTIEEHTKIIGKLFSDYSKVAGAPENRNDCWFGTAYSTEELITNDSGANRWVGRPFYRKRLNAIMNVDMSSCILIMSYGEASRLNIDPNKMVFLNGCGDAKDEKQVSRRRDLHKSPGIRAAGKEALRMAGITNPNTEIDFFDVYSCFPIAVEIACDELGIDFQTLGKPLTVTGGLPFHGGPGNNYVGHSICKMIEVLRHEKAKKKRDVTGLVTANGGYITKHAFGVYSTKPNQKHLYGEGWTREDPYVTQKRADEYSKPLASVTETPNGESSIETYTIMCDRNSQPERGIIIGRLTATNERFVANLSRNDIRSMNVLLEQDSIGIKGMVSTNSSGKSVFKIIEGIKNKSRL
eukprot:g8317.t1